MKYKILKTLLVFSLIPSFANASLLGLATKSDLAQIQTQILEIRQKLEVLKVEIDRVLGESNLVLGADAVLPFAGMTYTLSGSGVSGSATSITLTTLTAPQTGYKIQDSDLSNTFYITLEPGSRTRQEVASCTTVTQNADNTATLSGCSRGLLPFSPYTASTTYQFPHGGGTSVVFSNPPQLYNQFAGKDNDESITGLWLFSTTTANAPRYNGGISLSGLNTSTLAHLDYVNSVASSGAADATTGVKGIVELSTKSEFAAGTATGDTTASLSPPNSFFNATTSATTTGVVTKTGGKISQGFLDLTEHFAFSGGVSSTATTSITGLLTTNTTTISGLLTLNGSIVTNGLIGGSYLLTATTTDITVTASSTFNILNVTIPANTLGSSNLIRGEIDFTSIQRASNPCTGCSVSLNMVYGSTSLGTSTLNWVAGGSNRIAGKVFVDLYAVTSTATQEGSLYGLFLDIDQTEIVTSTPSQAIFRAEGGLANEDSTQAKTLKVTIQTLGNINALITRSFVEAIKTQN